MFKNKPVYILGIAVFTLVLTAELVLCFFVPAGFDRGYMDAFRGNKPGDSFGPDSSGFASLEDIAGNDGEKPGFDSIGGGEVQDKGDFGSMRPDGEHGDFTMPEGMEMPEDKELPEGMEMPEDFDPSAMPGKGQMGGALAIFHILRNAFWPVLIVCVIGDGLCIFMLVRISRKKKAAALQPSAASENSEEQSPVMGKDE